MAKLRPERCAGARPSSNRARARLSGLLLILGLAACAPDEPDSDGRAPAADSLAGLPASAVIDPGERRIRANGIAHARVGMTIGELRALLPTGATLNPPAPFMVDLDAMAVVIGADTLYRVLVPAGSSSADDARIQLLATENRAFRTADGIGPGTTLAEAEALLGAPTLHYNVADESREYARFPAQPRSILFRMRAASDRSYLAGVYATDGEYNETTRYDPNARIALVMVVLDRSDFP